MSETAAEPTVLARAERGVGHLTLNRPRAINALDLGMIEQLSAALDAWEHDPDIEVVLLDGAGDRGFCAGGDVRGLREQIMAGGIADTADFFRAEYALNARIAEYPKPIVAIADGVTMGGGIGLAGHAAVRVVTERSELAMPETRIGFTPDVGGSWLLAHAPGRTGEYLALTGETMDASDAIYAGFADALVPSDRLGDLRDAPLTRADPATPAELVLLFDETPGPSALAAARPWIDDAFAAPNVEGIIDRLRSRPEAEASTTADTLEGSPPPRSRSPSRPCAVRAGCPICARRSRRSTGWCCGSRARSPTSPRASARRSSIRRAIRSGTRRRWMPWPRDSPPRRSRRCPPSPCGARRDRTMSGHRRERRWSSGMAVDQFFFVFAGLAAIWLAYLSFTETLALGWWGIAAGIVFWVLLAHLVLPRLHRILTTIYVPDYFIGRAPTPSRCIGRGASSPRRCGAAVATRRR